MTNANSGELPHRIKWMFGFIERNIENQIIFIGLPSSKGGEVGKMDTLGNRDCQWASRSVLKDFIEGAVTISVGSLSQNGTARIVKANWRRRVRLRCWWNL